MTAGNRRMISVLAYSSIFVVLALGLVTVLPAGNRIDAAPQAPPVGIVEGSGAECLGDRVATVQSGVFLDLHVPGSHGAGDEDIGERLVGGQLDRLNGSGQLDGSCTTDGVWAGAAASYRVTVSDDGVIAGDVEVQGERLAATIYPADRGADGDRSRGRARRR